MKVMPLERYRPRKRAGESLAAQQTVREIIAAVQRRGDAALKEFSRRYDRRAATSFLVPAADIRMAEKTCAPDVRRAVQLAIRHLRCFARRQKKQCREFRLPVCPGVSTGQRVLPIARIGIYVPGGRYPLLSSLLMAAVPAQAAGVREIAVFSPPGVDGRVASPVLAAAGLLGLDEVYALGGAQAIAAMAFGTRRVPAVDKIVGPGNLYVTLAKQAVFGHVGIDLPAGPSEVAVLADGSARPDWIAADLLAQAEHDPAAAPLLITTSARLAAAVAAEVRRQLPSLATAATARRSLEANGAILLARSLAAAVAFVNRLAPEHLELHLRNARRWARRCTAFGSLFIGERAAEALGDYSSGLNHVLPTAGAARFSGGLSVRDFLRLATCLEVDGRGLRAIAGAARCLAEAEGLAGHARSLALRQAERSAC